MHGSGSQAFRQYAEGFKRMCALEADLAQELALRSEQARASLVRDMRDCGQANLTNAFSYHRQRVAR